MQTSTTTIGRRLVLLLLFAGVTAFSAQAQRTVTLQLNTATLADTISATSEIQVRGAVQSTAPYTLPDGNVIAWDDQTTLTPMNTGGDYWELSFQLDDDSSAAFKFYAQQSEDAGIGGWEDGDNHPIDAGTGDLDLGLHYFVKGDGQPYDWSPFEQKEDSVGVHFRVYMNTEAAIAAQYAADGSNEIAVRGEPQGSVPNLNWGMNNLVLSQESDAPAQPGYHLYSGIAYYPVSAAGTEQQYKFIVDTEGWESSDNRSFNVPAQDTTLHWVYFSNSPPLTQQPVEADVTFSVDLDPLERIGVFRRARGDTLQIRGSFNGWACSDPIRCLLEKEIFSTVFSNVILVNLVPGTELEYKYFIDYDIEEVQDEWGVDVIPSGWEEPLGTQGGNRSVPYEGEDLSVPQVYNDVFGSNIIPAGNNIEVFFSVDMSTATTAAEPFDPMTDSVTVTMQDPVFSLTQGFQLTPRDANSDGDDRFLGDSVDQTWFAQNVMLLEDPDPNDDDLVYEGSFVVSGPTYNGLQYKYTYGSPSASTWSDEAGANASGEGRRRTRFILANQDGSWPSEWTFPAESYQAEGSLPFEPNPALGTGIEPVDGEVPTQVSLGANYPNPFNPTTSFEYTLDRTLDVTLSVYDVLGRRVATLVDGTQQASTYSVTFDASQLASGTYIYRLETPNQVVTRTMVLLK